GWLAIAQKLICGQSNTLRLSQIPYPRDKGTCLPVSSPHSVVNEQLRICNE
ncbi:MAG: hypothetical protein ACI9LN_002960, partial [Saprospiraceae bacterium]